MIAASTSRWQQVLLGGATISTASATTRSKGGALMSMEEDGWGQRRLFRAHRAVMVLKLSIVVGIVDM